MERRNRRGWLFWILMGLGGVAFGGGALLPAGGQDHGGHPPGGVHSHGHAHGHGSTQGHGPHGPAFPRKAPSPIAFTLRQAEEITLRFAQATEHWIEKWVRTAGRSDPERQALRGRVFGPEAGLIQPGQQVRIFPLLGANRMLPGKVVGVTRNRQDRAKGAAPLGENGLPQDPAISAATGPQGDLLPEALVQVSFRDPGYREADLYVMEIIVPLGRRLSVPHEAILEEDRGKIVFVRDGKNRCRPRAVSVGIRGELYSEILAGLREGEEVATLGSFFLEAEHRLKTRAIRPHTGGSH